jgi:hypothetical protein
LGWRAASGNAEGTHKLNSLASSSDGTIASSRGICGLLEMDMERGMRIISACFSHARIAQELGCSI